MAAEIFVYNSKRKSRDKLSSRIKIQGLGAYIDSNMSMTNLIAPRPTGEFMLLSTSTNQADPLKSAYICGYTTIVISWIDYCNSLLFGLPVYQLHRIQQVLNAAARKIFGMMLHWLSVAERIHFKICLTVYKSLEGLSPIYISEFLKPVTDSHRRSTLHSATQDHLLVPMITSEYGKRSFAFAGPSCWNQLPDHVRQSPSVDTFKRRLKTRLFKLSLTV